jgi:hypothetical protein
MKLTYWVANRLNDSQDYNIRAPTKREALAELHSGGWNPEDYGPVHKVTVEYIDGFDLMEQCLSEDGGHWEYP